jgi:exonuclease III
MTHNTQYTTTPTPHPHRSLLAAAGVTLAIKDTYTANGHCPTLRPPPHLQGHITGIQLPSIIHAGGVLIVGVYITPGDTAVRSQIHTYLDTLLVEAAQTKQQVIITGDFNARLYPTDHHNHHRHMDTNDQMHQAWVTRHMLFHQGSPKSLPPQQRPHTYYNLHDTEGTSGSSRIDDYLDTLPHTTPRDIKVIRDIGGSDHLPLTTTIPSPGLGLMKQISKKEQHTRRIINTLQNLTHTQHNLIKDALTTQHTTDIANWTATLEGWIQTLLDRPDQPHLTQEIEDMATKITTLFDQYRSVAEITIRHPGHLDPRHRLRRTTSRKMRILYDAMGREYAMLTSLKDTAPPLKCPPIPHKPLPPYTKTTLHPPPNGHT